MTTRMNPITSAKMLEAVRKMPRTQAWLASEFSLKNDAVGRWARLMRKAGLLHISRYELDSRGREFAQVLSHGPGQDAERPGPRLTAAQRMAALRARRKGL